MAFQLLNPFTLLPVLGLSLAAYLFLAMYVTALFKKPSGIEARWQFRLLDLYVLIFQLAISGAITFEPDQEYNVIWNLGGLAVLWGMQITFWSCGVRALSRQKIEDPIQRVLLLGILMPLILFIPLTSCMMSMVCVLPFVFGLALLALEFQLINVLSAIVINPNSFVIRHRKLGWALCLLGVLAATPLSIWPMWCGYTIPPIYYKIHARRFRRSMRRTADVPAIQAWMRTAELSKWPNGDVPYLFQADCVKSLNANHVHYSPSGKLTISYGSGFGHWGIEVATTTSHEPDHGFALPLADGAWVWIEDH